MVKQYPDNVSISWKGEPYQDSNNNWVQSATSGTFSSVCRAEPNAKGATIQTQSGEDMYFDFDVYMPAHTTVIPIGADVTLTRHDGFVWTTKVKRANNGQLNSRLWV